MTITTGFDQPFFGGNPVTTDVPGLYPIALAGRPYMIDTLVETYTYRWSHASINLLRQQADQSQSTAESSINPEGYWRRAQDSWHLGAGQTYRDRDANASPYRFNASKGVNPWTKYQLTLLPDTQQKLSSANTNVQVVSAGSRLYYCDGSTVKYTTDATVSSPTWSSVTYAGGAVTGICSDGFNVYVTDGSNIYRTDTSSTAFSATTDSLDATIVAWVKSRLMAAKGNSLYNITTFGSGAATTFTHAISSFTWVSFAEGPANIYAAGYAGDKSQIYRIALTADATALTAPIIAGELPDGEIISSIQGYLGFMAIGSSKGFRLASINPDGSLSIGSLVTTPGTVQCFEPGDRFVWFGYTNYDTVSTGLGRIDLSVFTDSAGSTPAYASDLMVTGQGAVLSIASFQNRKVFTISGLGIYSDITNRVTSGVVTSGQIAYGVPDPKTAVMVDVSTKALVGSYSVNVSTDESMAYLAGSDSEPSDTSGIFPLTTTGERFEVQMTLNRSGTDNTAGPTLLRWTLKAIIAAQDGRSEKFTIPILLYPYLTLPGGQVVTCDCDFERSVISALRNSREIVTYQDGDQSYSGVVEDFTWYALNFVDDGAGGWVTRGTMVVSFKRTG